MNPINQVLVKRTLLPERVGPLTHTYTADQLDVLLDAARREAYEDGFKAGMTQAVWILRNAALTHEAESVASKKVVESEANLMAARILRSYANGVEIEADKPLP